MTSLLRSVLERRALTASSFWGYNITAATTSNSGVVVSQDTADRHSAVFGALALLSDDISTLPLKAYTTWGGNKREVPPATWMKTPIPLDPNYTLVEFLSQVVLSLLSDGNAFIRVMPDIATKAELRVLDPQRVDVKAGSDGLPVYTLYSQVGNVSQPSYGPFEVIHISYMRKPGRMRGLSPIESLAESIGAGMAAEEFSSRFYSQGANMTGVIETPQSATEITGEQAKKIKQDFTVNNTGLRNSHAVGILTGGAHMNWMTVKPSDALLIEAQQWSVEQIARAYKIPPHMLGSQQPGGQAYASVEQKSTDYVTHAVAPLCTRIETALSRLLPLNSYLEFSLQALLRADAKDRSFLYKALFDTGAASPNWIAEKENIPTFDGGDKHYIAVNNLSPIETPAGQAADIQTPDESGPQENSIDMQQQIRALEAAVKDGRSYTTPAVQVTVPTPEVHIAPAQVHVHPQINVEPAQVTVPAPNVRVVVPKQDPPKVTVRAAQPPAGPQEVVVTKMPLRSHRAVRNQQGQVEGSIEQDL